MYKLAVRINDRDPVLYKDDFKDLNRARIAASILEEAMRKVGIECRIGVVETGTKPEKETT
jgi:hypothetical protein